MQAGVSLSEVTHSSSLNQDRIHAFPSPMLNIIIHIDFLKSPLSIFLYTLVNMLLAIYLYRQYVCSTDTLLSAANLLKGYTQDTNRLEMDLL